MAELHTDASARVTIDGVEHDLRTRVDLTPAAAPPPPPPPPPVDSSVVTIGPGVFEYEEIHSHADKTLVILPGAILVRKDVPPANPDHANGGIVSHGRLIAVSKPGEAPITFRSANPTGHRGHIMLHGYGEFEGCVFEDLGRTTIDPISDVNPIAVYNLHWHLAGDASRGSRVERCVIRDTVQPSIYRHGVVLHGSNGVTVRGNLIQNKGGTGVFAEDGSENDCTIEGNTIEDIRNVNGLASHTSLPPRPVERPLWKNDLGFEGAGVWLRGTRNVVRNNTARRCAVGFMFYCDGSPSQFEPVRDFSGNVAEDCFDGGQPWHVGTDAVHDLARSKVGPPQVFGPFTARRCKRGVFAYYCGRVTFLLNLEGCPTGFTSADYRLRECEIAGAKITGSSVAAISVGSYINGGLVISDAEFSSNAVDVASGTPWHNGDARYLPPRLVTLRRCRSSSPVHIKRVGTKDGLPHYTLSDRLLVEDHQGVQGDGFEVFFAEQAADQQLPQSSAGGRVVGCPEAGLSNAQAMAKYSLCRAGALLPAGAKPRAGVAGLVLAS